MTEPARAGLLYDHKLLATGEWWLVLLISLHTFVVGMALFLVPDWALHFGGWEMVPAPFFPRQAGVFHFVLGIGYLGEYRRNGSVSLLVAAKTFAVVFLLGATFLDHVPWFVTFAGIGDGLMGLAAFVLHRLVGRAAAPLQA